MSRIYDNWERLVAATLKREQHRHLAYCESFSSRASNSSFDSFLEDVAAPSSSGKTSFNDLPTSSPVAGILSSPEAKPFSFQELKNATENFRPINRLAEGTIGYVYKGWIDEHTLTAAKPESGLAIVVKTVMLEEFKDPDKWLTVVNYLEQLHHPNLVKLIGYCSEDAIQYLVYEFMPKGSLRHHLSKSDVHWPLPWDARIKVAIDVARGLLFLHDRDSELVHGDVKSSSILFDEDFGAKLSGFHFTKATQDFKVISPHDIWGPIDHSPYISSPSRVSNGYNAPEYIRTGQLTPKCDVYSFGVVLIELLGGRFASQTEKRFSGDLVEWARPYLVSKRKLFKIMDTKLMGEYPKQEACTVATLALRCVSSNPKQRPHMKEVLGALEKLQN